MTNNVYFSEQNTIFKQRTGNDFEFYYKKYYPKLIYFATQITKNEQKAEDITTNAFLKALEKIDTYEKDKSQFSTWLFTIARNIAFQEIKLEKRNVSMDTTIDEDGTSIKDFIHEEESNDIVPNDLWERKAKIMQERIEKLKEPYKRVIVMREINKMAYKDIANILGKNLSTIKSQIRNGRHILMSQTKEDFDKIDEMYM